jgi:hypothetical protein
MMVGQKGQFLSRFTVAEGVDLLQGAASGSCQLRLDYEEFGCIHNSPETRQYLEFRGRHRSERRWQSP